MSRITSGMNSRISALESSSDESKLRRLLAKMGSAPRKEDFGDRQIEERMIHCEGLKR